MHVRRTCGLCARLPPRKYGVVAISPYCSVRSL